MPDHMDKYPITIENRDEPAHINNIDIAGAWYQPIVHFKRTGEYPPNLDKREKRAF